MSRNPRYGLSRRTVLKTAAVSSVAGFGVTTVTAQEDILEEEIELGGQQSAWVGQSPAEIEGERNPTLRLAEGREYTLTWENLDGVGHNFIIEDEAGENLVETDIVSGTGTTQTVEFTADAEMAEYYCAPHPIAMRGEIEVVDDDEPEDPEEPVEDVLVPEGPTVGLETVAEGLTAPTDLQAAPEETDRRFVTDQTGQIYVHGEDGLEDEPFLDLEDRMVELDEGFDERGVLGLAFHPDFAENGRFFVRYSAPVNDEPEEEDNGDEDEPEEVDHIDVLAEFHTAEEDNGEADPDSEQRILELPQPQFNHNAGPIAFGPDGYLYVTTGDGGGAGDVGAGHVEDWYDENEGGNGQDTAENLLGGILRIDVGVEDEPYAIPEDNPLVGYDEHHEEYYAWGMRNPWGMSFTEDGELLAADVGQALFEIVNHVEMGGNYGWNVKEGTHCFDPDTPEEPPAECPDVVDKDVPDPRGGEPLLDPVIEYPQFYGDQDVGIAIIGGHLYETDTVPDLEGAYVFGDWSLSFDEPTGSLLVSYPPEGWPEETELEEDFADQVPEDADEEIFDEELWEGLWPIEKLVVEADEDLAPEGDLERFVLGLGRDADGEMYVLTSREGGPRGETGEVHRIVDPTVEEPEEDEPEEEES